MISSPIWKHFEKRTTSSRVGYHSTIKGNQSKDPNCRALPNFSNLTSSDISLLTFRNNICQAPQQMIYTVEKFTESNLQYLIYTI